MLTVQKRLAWLTEDTRGLQAAYRRVVEESGERGGTEFCITHWLLNFPTKSPQSDDAWTELAYEVRVFIRGYGQLKKAAHERPRVLYEAWEPESRDKFPRVLPNKAEIRCLQEIVKQAMKSLLDEGVAHFPILAGQLEVRINQRSPSYFADRPFPKFCYNAASLVAKYSDRLKSCRTEGCHIIFVSRKNQEHHNQSCRSLAWKREKRGTPPERFNKRGRPKTLA
jgi:hypothetical protein